MICSVNVAICVTWEGKGAMRSGKIGGQLGGEWPSDGDAEVRVLRRSDVCRGVA